MKFPYLFQNEPLVKKQSEYNVFVSDLQKVQGRILIVSFCVTHIGHFLRCVDFTSKTETRDK